MQVYYGVFYSSNNGNYGTFLVLRETYSKFTGEGVLANILGLMLVCFGVVVGYVVTREDFRRPPNPEEEALSVHFKTLSEGEIPSSP